MFSFVTNVFYEDIVRRQFSIFSHISAYLVKKSNGHLLLIDYVSKNVCRKKALKEEMPHRALSSPHHTYLKPKGS